jgi:hypothetical protein
MTKKVCQLQYKHYEDEKKEKRLKEKKESANVVVPLSNSLLISSVNIFIVCDSYFFFPLVFLFYLSLSVLRERSLTTRCLPTPMSTIDEDNNDDMGDCHICFCQEKDNNEIVFIVSLLFLLLLCL